MKKLMTALLVLAAPMAFAAVDATEVGPAVKEKTQDLKSKATDNWNQLTNKSDNENQATFQQAKAFQLSGTVEKASKGKVTIGRQGLPAAVLDVRDQTMVTIDGQRAKPDELQQGAQVRARFQLEGGQPVAVRIDAKKGQATGGAGAAGSSEKKASNAAQNAENKAESGAHQAKDTAERGGQKAEQGAQQAGEKAKQAGQDVKDSAQQQK
jgi:hypothetical protein